MPGAVHTVFKQWGRYTGTGMKLQGKANGVAVTARIFAFTASGKTCAIVETFRDDQQQQMTAALRIIEASFQVTK